MGLAGTVMSGVVVLDNGHNLADGTRVEVVVTEPTAESTVPKPTLTALLELAGTVDDLPPDMARNHDHYIQGAPKR